MLALTILVYLPGLHGPFLFDDPPNLILPIQEWMHGQIGWDQFVFGNDSGLLGRPLSMLTFFANAATTGLATFPFKLTNLVIHLACGMLVYALLSRLLLYDPQFASQAKRIALVVSALWLLHPMQVSTVLYIVQRMAQLSTLFTLMALLAYVHGRMELEQNRQRNGLLLLFLALPLATLCATFSKENGALVPLLCAILELAYFRASTAMPRPRAVHMFFVLFLLLPVVLVLSYYGMHPHRLIDSYQGRLFTLGERLLSEPRALMDYLGALLLPRGALLGLYTDDFAISHGLLDPPSTLFAIIGLVALASSALFMRMRLPAYFAGIALYLAAQIMESTVFPLELYFEHRNYLPSIGLFLAAVALAASLITRVLPHTHRPGHIRRLIGLSTVALFAVLSLATLIRASAWSSWHGLAAEGVQQHPNSMRALLDDAVMLQLQGRYDETQQIFDHMAAIDNPAARHVALIDTVALQCMAHGQVTAGALVNMRTVVGAKLQLAEMLAFENFSNYLQDHDCQGLSKVAFATILIDVVNAAPQPATLTPLWRTRFNAARLYLAAGMNAQGMEQTARAWMPGTADVAVGILLARLYYNNGDPASSQLILNDARKRIGHMDKKNLTLIDKLQRQLDGIPTKSAAAVGVHAEHSS
ncbi:hypothetical protein [Rhodanobacter sp. MP7CTX1]|uniref:hypothetical protein n=1 Tax=Rhodanobacter sp. MP7CTX1 TaxID=2723084 RepID=UPI00160CA8C8|nr:hypothetical protein [Rhodanobacter sp. MP7CTX1]MBB6187256.1 putative nucleic acid-binding Zn ribbon protein [Rhodanobacter sp. MP7CTX1]